MLGVAWAFIKVNKPDEAIKPAQWIIANLPKSFLISEAYLVEGYCHFMKKNYNVLRPLFVKLKSLLNNL